MSTYTEVRTLDLLKHNGTAGAIPPVVLRRGDAGTVIQGVVKLGGEAFSLSGYTAQFCAVNAGGGVVRRDATITDASNGIVAYTVTDDLTAIAGPVVVAYFELTKGGEVATTDTLPFIVLKDADIDAEHASAYQSELDRLNAQLTALVRAYINSAEAEMDDAMDDFAASMGTLSEKIAEANAAIEAIGDISELAVPLMDAYTLGGAKLGDGLHVENRALSLGPLTKSGEGAEVSTDGCALFAVTGEGWAEQDTTTGKNLLPDVFSISSQSNIPISLAAGTYALSGTLASGCELSIRFNYANDSKLVTASTLPVSITLDEAVSSFNYSITNFSAGCFSNPQLESGSTPTSWEPYSGGQPSPRPDWAQEIKVCRGRNLVNPDAMTSGYWNTATGEAETSSSWIKSEKMAVEPGDYVIDGKYASSFGNFVAYDKSGAFVSSLAVTNIGGSAKRVTVPANAAFIAFYCGAIINGSPMDKSSLILAKGSQPMPYVPYGHVGIEVQSRNLIYDTLVGGTISDSGVVTNSNSGTYSVVYAKVKAGETYTVKASNGTSSCRHAFYSSAPSAGSTSYNSSYTNDPSTPGYFSFTAPIDGYVAVRVPKVYTEHQIEQGSTAHAYGPYQHDTVAVPLPSKGWAGAAGDFGDALSIDSAGGYRWDVETAEYVVTGSETIQSSSALSNDIIRCSLNALTNANARHDSTDALLTHEPVSNSWTGAFEHFYVNYQYLHLFSAGSTAEEVRQKFVGAVLLYALNLPTTETGYITLPDLPSGAVVSCPELDSIGVSWFVAGYEKASEHAQNMLARAIHDSATDDLANVAPVEGKTASTNYSVNSYLVHDGVLYKVTTAIATGEEIKPGTNVTATTVMTEMLTLTA